MNKCYYRIEWKNYPSDETPLNEQNLNKIDVAVDEIDNRIISLDSTKFDKSEAQLLVKYIEYDENNGIFKITHYNGASYTIDTLLEKLAVNFDYDYQTQQLIIELSDGEIKYVDLSALITQYEFLDSETVAFSVDNGGKVTAIVKEGSIEGKHLSPDYLADIKVESAKAEASATKAGEKANDSAQGALLSKSYSDGDSGIRDGEVTDNARYYSEQAKKYFENLEQAGTVTGIKGNSESSYRTGNVNLTAENIGALPINGGILTGPITTTSHIYGINTTTGERVKDIDLDGTNMYFGKRVSDAVCADWLAYLEVMDNTVLLKSPDAINFIVSDTATENVKITKNNIKVNLPSGSFDVSAGKKGYFHFKDNVNLISDNKIEIISNQSFNISTKLSGVNIASIDNIRLVPGGVDYYGLPDLSKYVKTGNIQGIKDVNGNKPSITNYGKINSSVFNASTYVGIGSDDLNKPVCSITQFTDPRITSGVSNQYPALMTENSELYKTIYSGGHIFTDGFFYILNSRIIRNSKENVTITDNVKNGVCMIMEEFSPYSKDGSDVNLGSSARKWGNIFAKTGSITTSDRNKKTNIIPLPDDLVKDFIMGLIPSSFSVLDGTSGRAHWGLISQDVEELMDKLGMNSNDFAGFIKSPKTILRETDENGNLLESPIKEVVDGEYDYSLRYNEFIAPIIKVIQMQQAEIKSLQEETTKLKAELLKIVNRF